MGSIISKIYGVTALFALIGTWIYIVPHTVRTPRTEAWLKAKTPYDFKHYHYVPGTKDPTESFKMDQKTYEILMPEAVIGRTYQDNENSFDVVTLVSESKDSFHDPRICFSSQGWTVENYTPIQIHSKTRGIINVSLVRINSKKEQNKLALFFYRIGQDTFGTPQSLKLGLVWNRIKGNELIEGIFYRFIPSKSTINQEELINFVIDYVDAINISSQGVL